MLAGGELQGRSCPCSPNQVASSGLLPSGCGSVFVLLGMSRFSPALEPAQILGVPLGLRTRVLRRGGCARRTREGLAPATLHKYMQMPVHGRGWRWGAPVLLPITPFRHLRDRDSSAVTCWAGTVGKALAAGAGLPRETAWAHGSPRSRLETLCRFHHG